MYSDVMAWCVGLGTVGCVCASRRILAKRSAQHSGRGGASRALRRPCDGCVSAAHVRTSLAPEPAQAVNNGLRQAEARSADSPPCLAFGAARCDMLLPDQTYEGAERRGAGALLVMLRAHRLPPDFFCANRAAQERANGTTPLSIRLDIDAEAIILKIYAHFSYSAERRAELMQIFETTEMEWVELLRYVNTRFMSLCPAVESFHHQGLLLACLKRYFDKQESCSKAIKMNFYSEAEETKTQA
ncbi:unnamed protein product [Arctia plantaginis]|uniref:Uncharacterized protein n=1 Tax=Arctia plantaginis TaxID=874455 RepID=A0A8S1BHK7_ARCPL|nr:unnamed protein product [Arctia plantaginis]